MTESIKKLALLAENRQLRQTVRGLEAALQTLGNEADHLRSLVFRDELTGLPNRRSLVERFKNFYLRQGARAQFAVLFIDVDNFKQINDSAGHRAGDALLRQVAASLSGLIRFEDLLGQSSRPSPVREAGSIVSRFGGDEFVVVLAQACSHSAAISIAQRILRRFEQPFVAENTAFWVTASIGIAFYPHDGESADSLLRSADEAMYRAKQSGKARFALCAPRLQSVV